MFYLINRAPLCLKIKNLEKEKEEEKKTEEDENEEYGEGKGKIEGRSTSGGEERLSIHELIPGEEAECYIVEEVEGAQEGEEETHDGDYQDNQAANESELSGLPRNTSSPSSPKPIRN